MPSTALKQPPKAAPPSRRERRRKGLLEEGSKRAAASAPPKSRRRSWGLILVAALLVIGTGLGVAAWGLSAGERVSVLAVAGPVARGEVIERADLVSVSVAGVAGAIPVDQAESVIGKTAAVELVEGQILTDPLLEADPVPAPRDSMIGLALDPTRIPGSLKPGDVVDVIATPPGGETSTKAKLAEPVVLAESAEVWEVKGETTAGGQTLVTVIVARSDAGLVASYSTQNRLALVEVAANVVATPRDEDVPSTEGGS